MMMDATPINHLQHSVLKDILKVCEDQCQGYTAFNLLIWLNEHYEMKSVKWSVDPFLRMVILKCSSKDKCKIFLPLYFTFHPSPKWIKESLDHFKETSPQASVHMAFSSSSGTFVMYETSDGLQMPKHSSCEDMKKSRKVSLNTVTPDQT